jgi:hypothetical protein
MTSILAFVAAIPPVIIAVSVVFGGVSALCTLLGATIPRTGRLASVQTFCARAGVTVGHVGDLLHKTADDLSPKKDA